MTKEQVRGLIEAHNNEIDHYISVDLPKALAQAGVTVRNGKIPCSAWFLGNELIREQAFYEQACKFQKEMRACGYDVKRDAQSNKLVWYGGMI